LDATLLGQRIRQARERKRLSQEDFAAQIGRDQRAVSEYEHGTRRIAVIDLPTIARVLDEPLLYFYGEDLNNHDLDTEILKQFHRLPDIQAQQAAIDLLRIFSDTIQNRVIMDE
jgi:transcriptional regulator with XRE-family HTH domain